MHTAHTTAKQPIILRRDLMKSLLKLLVVEPDRVDEFYKLESDAAERTDL